MHSPIFDLDQGRDGTSGLGGGGGSEWISVRYP